MDRGLSGLVAAFVASRMKLLPSVTFGRLLAHDSLPAFFIDVDYLAGGW